MPTGRTTAEGGIPVDQVTVFKDRRGYGNGLKVACLNNGYSRLKIRFIRLLIWWGLFAAQPRLSGAGSCCVEKGFSVT